MRFGRYSIAIIAVLYITLSTVNVFAMSETEKTFLSMYFKDEELVVLSATRSLKSITRIAENVEVVTKEDIELMNAHTVADVLRSVPGVAVFSIPGSVGSETATLIQGSDVRHVAFFMDGIPLNTLSDNQADSAMIPAQIVDRIEIVKGPGSSAWGSSLGGVVNIITKTPGQSEQPGGTLAASFGERKMSDFRADIYGKKSDLGYYLYAGHLGSDGANGLIPNSGNWSNNFYTKLTYDLSKDTNLLFSLAYMKNSRGEGEFADFDYSDRDRNEMLLSSLALNTVLSREIKLGLSIWTHRSTFSLDDIILSTRYFSSTRSVNHIYGGNIKLDWNHDVHKVVAGIDLDTALLQNENVGTVEKRRNKFGVFINDTIELEKLSVIPGIRYDHSSLNGGFVSPSLGMTYMLDRKTLLRAFIARGFNYGGISNFMDNTVFGYKANPDLRPERIMSYQAGIETSAVEAVWLKLSAFSHELKNAITGMDITDPIFTWTLVNGGRQRRQGLELEFRTAPVYNVSVRGGVVFADVKDLETGEKITGVPRYSYDLGINYDDKKALKALLVGRYMWWNADPSASAHYNGFITDLHVIRNIFKKSNTSLEAFLSAHNIFDGTQNQSYASVIPSRWVEGGIRYKF